VAKADAAQAPESAIAVFIILIFMTSPFLQRYGYAYNRA
jgi:hypothetical protein